VLSTFLNEMDGIGVGFTGEKGKIKQAEAEVNATISTVSD